MINRLRADIAALQRRLSESEATVKALVSGEVDAVFDPRSNSPVLLGLAQKALRESEERYRSIVETANEGICMMDFNGLLSFTNQRFADMLGFSIAEVTGQSLYTFIPSAFHEKAKLRLQRATLGFPEESEAAILQRSGHEMWVLVKSSCIRNAAGECVGMLAMMTDWTRHREAERALRESEAEYRQIVESTTDGIIKVNRAGNIGFVNARLAEMLGYTPTELVGTSLLTVLAPSERASVNQSLQEHAQEITPILDTFYRHKSGAEISVNVAGSALRDELGELIGTLGVVRDVTERNKLQAQLMVSDRMASVGTLAAGVAHEINNPLAAVMANLEYIDEGVTMMRADNAEVRSADWIREQIAEPLADAREAAERVRFIVRDLMVFSRSPSDEPQLAVDVNAVLESSLRMGWNEIRHRADLVKNLANVPLVKCNQARLGQVFLNLIVNAAQSLPVGHLGQHEIRISTRQAGQMVLIEIADTGSGIASEVIERIFDAFYTTKSVGGGTGLGLAICQRIVTDMGGTLTVRSALGVGSTFCVALPVAKESNELAVIAPVARIANLGERMLVVDDEEIISRIVQRSLSSTYEIITTRSAWGALALVEAGETFDVILCDLMMPEMSGMDLHAALLARSPDQARRMIFMTGGAFTDEARQFIADADVTHIDKPFDLENLRRCIQDFLGSLKPTA